MAMQNISIHAKNEFRRIILPYLIFAVLWIILSDLLLDAMRLEPAAHTRLSIFKGWAFVLVTAALLFFLLRSERVAREKTQAVTEQALRESELKYRMLFETAGDAILLIRGDKFIDCNAKTLTMFGCTRDQIIGTPPYEFSPPTQQDGRPSEEKAKEKINLALVEGPQTFEWLHCRKDRTLFIAEVSLNRLELNGETILQAIVRDITERKQVEEKLHRLGEHLEELVWERTSELAAAMEKAQAADKIKSAFLATMSHELRTPLNSIIGFTGILLQGLAGPLNDEQQKQMKMVQESARHLLALINDILDISKIEAGQLSLAIMPVEVKPSIEKVAKMAMPLAQKKGLELRLDISDNLGFVIAEQRRLEQVILNLLNNAIKFTEKGYVSLSCRAENNHYILTVSDTGIGIPPEKIPEIFKPFHQIDTGLTRQYDGTGLGLSICKKLVDMMGGSIHVESEPSKGSNFIVRLLNGDRGFP